MDWGINFKRFVRQKNEEDLWAAWRRMFGATKISQAGQLGSISEIGSSRLFIIKPYALTGYQYWPASAASAGLTPGTQALYTGRLDVKIGIRSNLVANLTANTDFADADVDPEKFNITPYKLFYPWKRQFFLENAGILNFSLGGESDQLFFSRQIGVDPNTGQQVPVNGGAKVAGTIAGFDVDLLTRPAESTPGLFCRTTSWSAHSPHNRAHPAAPAESMTSAADSNIAPTGLSSSPSRSRWQFLRSVGWLGN